MAVGGGGRRTTDVVQTASTAVGPWEKFTLVPQGGNQYALQTVNDTYLTAVDGGGKTTDVVHTDATNVGPWEKFTLEVLPAQYHYVLSMTYNAAGQLTSVVNRNGVTETFFYEPSRARLETSTAKAGTTTLFDSTYRYFPDGLVRSSQSATHRMNQAFTYDGLHRLKEVTGDFAQTFSYDDIGNMTYNSALGTYVYCNAATGGCPPSGGPHAVVQAGNLSFAYDSNGNMKIRAGATYTWNQDNMPSQIGATSFQYNGDSERVMKGSTSYFGSLFEEDGPKLTRYYYASPRLVARREGPNPTDVFWYHQDRLGSTRLTTNASGQETQRFDYEAYGGDKPNPTNPSTDLRYTGHRKDDETGLIYMGARFYDPLLGRFLSADTVVPEAGSPQGLNRFSYAYNNPISNSDPTGHQPEITPPPLVTVEGLVYGYFDMVEVVLPEVVIPPPPQTVGEALNRGWLHENENRVSIPRDATGEVMYEAFTDLLAFWTPLRRAPVPGAGLPLKLLPRILRPDTMSVAKAAGSSATLAKYKNILHRSAMMEGNFGLGTATAEEALELGQAWVGAGARLASDGKTLVSADGLHQFRPPSFKPMLQKVQANFEARSTPSGRWQSNGHLDIK